LALALLACAAGAALAVAASGGGATAARTGFVAQGEKLVPVNVRGESHVGRSVALSRDGDTALVGGPPDSGEAGPPWAFVRSGATWHEEGRLEVGGGEGSNFFGRGVALSGDGNPALVGAPGNARNVGAAWVFTRSGTTWTRQARLDGTGESGQGQLGRSVS